MEKLIEFVTSHLNDDISRLILDRKKYPEINMDLAVASIESRRKLKGKVQEWHDEPGLIFPLKLSAEQCSSSATGRYKSDLAERIAGCGFRIADLTGGLGVDSWFFSRKASQVLYNEMQEPLYNAAGHNFKVLKSENIERSCIEITTSTIADVIREFNPDIIYMDPARRGEGGRKVFLIEECTPDVLGLRSELFKYCRHLLIKLSPMADISMVCERLGRTCREVHVVATGGECKELLIWMDREYDGEPAIHAAELHTDNATGLFSFSYSEEKSTTVSTSTSILNSTEELILFEPGKALMKAGPFNLISARFNLHKLGKSTHYYISSTIDKSDELKRYGKIFRIREYYPLDKRALKEIGKKYPKSEVTARNIPMDSDTLRKKAGVTSGDDAHIFGLKSDSEGNILLIAERI